MQISPEIITTVRYGTVQTVVVSLAFVTLTDKQGYAEESFQVILWFKWLWQKCLLKQKNVKVREHSILERCDYLLTF